MSLFSSIRTKLRGYYLLLADGIAVPERERLNFIGATVTDNPAQGRTDITITPVDLSSATPLAIPSTIASRDANADTAFRRVTLTDKITFTTAGALVVRQAQSTTGNGVDGSIYAQAAKIGAYDGGALTLGGGDPGDVSHLTGDTVIQLGPVVTGSRSGRLLVMADEVAALGIASDSTTAETQISAGGGPIGVVESIRFRGAVALAPHVETSAASITFAGGKGSRRDLILKHNVAFQTPTGFDDGAELEICIEQDTGGPWAATWPGGLWIFPAGIASALIGTAQYDVDYYVFRKRGNYWFCILHNKHVKP